MILFIIKEFLTLLEKSMTAAIAPGPEINGIASGTRIGSLGEVLSTCSVGKIIPNAMSRRRIPPPMLRMGGVIPKKEKIFEPKKLKIIRIIKAKKNSRMRIIRCFFGSYLSSSLINTGIFPSTLLMKNKETPIEKYKDNEDTLFSPPFFK